MKLRAIKHRQRQRTKPPLTAEQFQAKVRSLIEGSAPKWSDKELVAMLNGGWVLWQPRLAGRATFRRTIIEARDRLTPDVSAVR